MSSFTRLREAPRWLDASEVQWQMKQANAGRRGVREFLRQQEEFSAIPGDLRGDSLAARYAAEYAGRAAGEAFQACDRIYDPWLWDRLVFRRHRAARIAEAGGTLCERCDGNGSLQARDGFGERDCGDCDGHGNAGGR
jgi:hypothetical protein